MPDGIDDKGHRKEQDAHGKEHVVVRAPLGHLAHLGGDGRCHGAHRFKGNARPQAGQVGSVAGHHHHRHGLANGARHAQHHRDD